jgi:GPH family glycoside/pentoside/hexuronide:cation symporter
MSTKAALPRRVLAIYAAGQFGWSLASYGVSNLLTYFYMPPETQQVFPSFVFQGTVLGIFTLIGLISAWGRLVDAAVDPLVAHWSDRKVSRIGKRQWFLLFGAVPLAVFGFLAFYPLTPGESTANFLWLTAAVAVYYFFFAFYVIPYTALLTELGRTESERMLISTVISAAWGLGFVVGNSALAIQSALEARGYAPVEAFQAGLAGLAALSAVFMLIPGLFLREHRYARQTPTDFPLRQALGVVIANRNFRHFLVSDLMYWLALNFVQIGMAYYTTLLLGLDKSYVFHFALITFIASFLFYAPINFLARRYGKKRVLLAGFLIFAVLFTAVALIRFIPLPGAVVLYGLAFAGAFPLAVFGILPNALIADVVDDEERSSGQLLAGMYYGIRAFVMKIGVSLGNLIFPSLLQFGKSKENPAGVELTAWAALVFCLAGWQAFRRYRD